MINEETMLQLVDIFFVLQSLLRKEYVLLFENFLDTALDKREHETITDTLNLDNIVNL